MSVASKLDFKMDGTQSRRLTMWMKKIINGYVEERKSIGDGWMVSVCGGGIGGGREWRKGNGRESYGKGMKGGEDGKDREGRGIGRGG